MSARRVLVTGASGHLGNVLVRAAVDAPEEPDEVRRRGAARSAAPARRHLTRFRGDPTRWGR